MSSSADSSSSEEDFDILNVIDGGNKKSKTSVQSPKRRRLRSAVPKVSIPSKDNDDFNIEIPSIFKTQAKRNEELLNKDKQIKKYIQQQEENVMTEHNRILSQKQEILNELNDSETNAQCSLDNEKDNNMVEKLVRQVNDLGDDSLVRNFYFYSKRSSQALDCSVPLRINDHLFQMKPHHIFNMFKYNFTQFINYCITNITNISELQTVLKCTEYAPQAEVDISTKTFNYYLACMGGDISILGSSTIPLKMRCDLMDIKLHILRLTIIFKFVIRCNKSENLYMNILKAFILTIIDYNLNKKEQIMLNDFSSTIFKDLVTWRLQYLSKISDDEDKNFYTLVSEIKNMVDSSLTAYKYNNVPYKLNKKTHELCFHVLNVLQSSCNENDSAKVVSLLSFSLLINPTIIECSFSLGKDSNYIVNSLKLFLEDLELVDLKTFSSKHCISSVNQIYSTYYKLLHFQSLFYQYYQRSLLISKGNGEGGNFRSTLKDLATIISKVEIKLYNQLELAGVLNLNGSQLYYKDEMIKYTTSSYHVINLLHKQLNKEVGSQDTEYFYS